MPAVIARGSCCCSILLLICPSCQLYDLDHLFSSRWCYSQTSLYLITNCELAASSPDFSGLPALKFKLGEFQGRMNHKCSSWSSSETRKLGILEQLRLDDDDKAGGECGVVQINYLGPYVLTRLLEEYLVAAAPSRVRSVRRRFMPFSIFGRLVVVGFLRWSSEARRKPSNIQ
jgi:hypothetical protein